MGKNSTFTIELEENSTTGFRWNAIFDSEVFRLVNDEFISKAPTKIGGGGRRKFTFRPLKSGRHSLKFEYKRGWEKEAIKSIEYLVVVQ